MGAAWSSGLGKRYARNAGNLRSPYPLFRESRCACERQFAAEGRRPRRKKGTACLLATSLEGRGGTSPALPRQAHRRTRVPRKSRTPQRQLAGPPPQQMRCPHPQPSGFTGERRHKRQPPDGTRGIDGPPLQPPLPPPAKLPTNALNEQRERSTESK